MLSVKLCALDIACVGRGTGGVYVLSSKGKGISLTHEGGRGGGQRRDGIGAIYNSSIYVVKSYLPINILDTLNLLNIQNWNGRGNEGMRYENDKIYTYIVIIYN